jgi:hypothetical protein
MQRKWNDNLQEVRRKRHDHRSRSLAVQLPALPWERRDYLPSLQRQRAEIAATAPGFLLGEGETTLLGISIPDSEDRDTVGLTDATTAGAAE